MFQKYLHAFRGLHSTVWILSTVLFINRVGSMVLFFSALYFTQHLHFSKAEAGVITGFFGLGSILGSYIGGWLADRYNNKHIMVSSLLLSGGILLFILFTKNFYVLCAVLFLYALFADAFRPSSSKQITQTTTEENRTRSISLMRLSINLGMAIGPAIGGLIAFYFGYKILYLLDAITSFVAAGFLFFNFQNQQVAASQKLEMEMSKSKSAYQDKPYILFIFLVSIYAICFFQLISTIPTFFKEVYHYNEKAIGYLLSLNCLIVALFEMPMVAVLEKRQKPFFYISIGCLCIAVAYFLLIINPAWIWLSVVYVVVITLSEMFAMPFMMTAALNRASKDRQGQYSAFYSIAYGIALAAAPTLGLWLSQKMGFHFMLTFFICLSIIIAIGMRQFRNVFQTK